MPGNFSLLFQTFVKFGDYLRAFVVSVCQIRHRSIKKTPALPCEIQYNITTAFAFPFSEVKCCHQSAQAHLSTLALPLQENKNFFFFIIITDNSFFKCGSLGKACLMHFELITIFSLMVQKLYSALRNESPPTQHIRNPLCSFHWVKQEISSFTQTLCLRWSYRDSSGTS